METVSTWIKLHRKIVEWGWYGDPNTKAVFLHLLLTANIKETEFRGVKILPGQTVIGRKALAETLGMSEQSVRTSLNHLKSTNEITITSTNRFSVVTVVNWESYQLCGDEVTNKSTNKPTNNQPTTNQQLTTPKEYKNKRIKDIYIDVPDEIKDVFMEWAAMRKDLKKPITSRTAVSRALNKLNALSQNTDRQRELIEYAIYRNWLSFYPIPQEDQLPKKKKEEPKPKKIDAVPMPENTREKMAALGFGNLIGKETK